EAQILIRHLAPLREPYALAIRLDFNMFIRVGEIAGLKWENIDLERRNAYICHQVTYEPELNDDLTFSEKKMVTEDYLKGCTSQGYRNEYLTDEAIEILKVAREINPDGEYVFMPFGKPIITTTFNKRLKKYCGEVCIPYRSSHKIRFYAASTAYNGENLPVVSRLMGHSQISTTMHYLRDVIQDNNYADAFQNLGRQNPA
ncbi:MAG: site-specific integrase, partial [Eubacterium sp.]|nr:site-specific integrase [Eubacterium sp.]